MTVYAVLDYQSQRFVLVLRCTLGSMHMRGPYQLIIVHRPCATELFEFPPPTLESPNFHLFVCHKLQRAVAHTH
jgi:hypothetical protein